MGAVTITRLEASDAERGISAKLVREVADVAQTDDAANRLHS